MSPATSILLVEDDDSIGSVLCSELTERGYDVRWAQSAAQALALGETRFPDLVLLDLGLPDRDGIELCRELRAIHPEAVIIVLTARRDELDVIVGLEAGADDYLTKPLRFAELVARIRAHLRRSNYYGEGVIHRVGALTVDGAARRATLDGHPIALRAKEFDLLARLCADPDKALSRETLMADVWDENWFGSTKTLDVHIAAVRARLVDASEASGAAPPIITTLRGHGYRLENRSI